MQTATSRRQRDPLRIKCALIDELICLFIVCFGSVIVESSGAGPFSPTHAAPHPVWKKEGADKIVANDKTTLRLVVLLHPIRKDHQCCKVRDESFGVLAKTSRSKSGTQVIASLDISPQPALRLLFREERSRVYAVGCRTRRSRFAPTLRRGLQGTLPKGQTIRRSPG